MPKELDPNDPKWKKENRDPRDRDSTPARQHEHDKPRDEKVVNSPPPEKD